MLEPVDGSSTQVTLMHAGFQKQNEKDVEAGFSLEASWTQFLISLNGRSAQVSVITVLQPARRN
jgi:hypothetical protein